MNNRGFTLVEMLIVVAIIGFLAALAIPGYIGYQRNAARTEAKTNLENLRMLEEQFFADNGRYTPTTAPLTRNYLGTSANDNGIEDVFARFNPAGRDNAAQFDALNYTYTLQTDATGTTFTATATGKTGRRSHDDAFTINNTNTRTGPW